MPNFFQLQRNKIIIFIVWAITEAVLLKIYGIHTNLEAVKYINQADYLLKNGSPETSNFWFYSVQIFLIALIKKLHLPYLTIVIIQWTGSFIAVLSIYKLIVKLFDKTTALVLTIYFLLNIPFFTFNTYLQTESLFFSLTVIFSCYILSLKRLTPLKWIKIWLFIFLICFTRPSGLFWILPSLLFLFFKFFRNISLPVKLLVSLTMAGACLFFLNVEMGSGGELDFMLPFRNECIICGVPTVARPVDINISSNPNSLQGILYYITHNSNRFSRMAWLHTKAFWGLQRNYFSNGHNVFLVLLFYPLYVLAIAAIPFWMKRNRMLLFYCLAIIFITWMSVILSCDDWHNRFFLSISPYIYILSAPVIKTIIGKTRPDLHSRHGI
ncbi:MAG TPA: hypothetical protein VG847_05730 [Chitinophagaceae bacterium]|nr:hypothetical protein [Chitinophagaceae bacterium]